MTQSASQQQRLRLTFNKGAAVKYVGHLDLVRAWERALRRANAPLAYSKGYNPQPKLQFASALPLGSTGRQELVDVLLTERVELAAFLALVREQLPAGLELLAAEEAPLKSKALQARLRASKWQADAQTPLSPAELNRRVDDLLAQAAVPRSRLRKGRTVTYDLRTQILALRYAGQPAAGWHRLLMTLRSEPGATGRPNEVLAALGLEGARSRLERLCCLFAPEDGGQVSPTHS